MKPYAKNVRREIASNKPEYFWTISRQAAGSSRNNCRSKTESLASAILPHRVAHPAEAPKRKIPVALAGAGRTGAAHGLGGALGGGGLTRMTIFLRPPSSASSLTASNSGSLAK